jgi:hypothetical protein
MQLVSPRQFASVHTVMIGGRIVFHDGKLLTLDENLLRRGAQEAALRLDAANGAALAAATSVAKFVGMFCAAQGCAGHASRRHLGIVCET